MKIKITNRRILTLLLSGFILINATACKAKLESVNQNSVYDQNTSINQDINEGNINSGLKSPGINQEENIIDKDSQIISHFENLETEITYVVNNNHFESLKIKTKEIFIKMVDFLLYGEPINGITFDELKTETKTKVLEIFKNIDSKIVTIWPNYKEDISNTANNSYNLILDKTKEYLNELDSHIEDKIGSDTYNEIKDAYEDTKEVNDRNINIIKDGIEDTKEKVKNWYQEFKNNN